MPPLVPRGPAAPRIALFRTVCHPRAPLTNRPQAAAKAGLSSGEGSISRRSPLSALTAGQSTAHAGPCRWMGCGPQSHVQAFSPHKPGWSAWTLRRTAVFRRLALLVTDRRRTNGPCPRRGTQTWGRRFAFPGPAPRVARCPRRWRHRRGHRATRVAPDAVCASPVKVSPVPDDPTLQGSPFEDIERCDAGVAQW